jgi:hypothetical protein
MQRKILCMVWLYSHVFDRNLLFRASQIESQFKHATKLVPLWHQHWQPMNEPLPWHCPSQET